MHLRTGSQEPRLDNVAQLGGRALVFEHLLGVVPAHAAAGRAAAHEDDFTLIGTGFGGHDCG